MEQRHRVDPDLMKETSTALQAVADALTEFIEYAQITTDIDRFPLYYTVKESIDFFQDYVVEYDMQYRLFIELSVMKSAYDSAYKSKLSSIWDRLHRALTEMVLFIEDITLAQSQEEGLTVTEAQQR